MMKVERRFVGLSYRISMGACYLNQLGKCNHGKISNSMFDKFGESKIENLKDIKGGGNTGASQGTALGLGCGSWSGDNAFCTPYGMQIAYEGFEPNQNCC